MSRFARLALSRFLRALRSIDRSYESLRSSSPRDILRSLRLDTRHFAERVAPESRDATRAFDRSDPPLGTDFRPSRFTFVPSATFIRFRGSRRNYGRRFLDDSLLRLAELRPRLEFLGTLQARRRSVFSQRLHNCRRNVTRECPDAGRAARRIAGANEMARAR